MVPLFLELRPYLERLWDPDQEFVINRYRCQNSNLRTQLLRIMKQAGVEPWPRLFHNMRASRQTELEYKHPSHVVCTWMGESGEK